MPQRTRRIVTGHDANGKAVVLIDGEAPNVKLRANTNIASTQLWVTDECPADISQDTDRAAREIGVAPPARGSVLRIVESPPLAGAQPAVDSAALRRDMGLPAEAEPARHPFMHRTRTVDYAIVLEGEIDMLLDEEEVHLRAGDVVVQQGTNHAWVNNGTRPCRIAFVLIDARELPAWGISPGS
jgi:mannose-6-phosphate isomerase-like protein (cupin superfamily)